MSLLRITTFFNRYIYFCLLQAPLTLEHFTTTVSQSHTGRAVIGQFHADDDEPIRLYFKKFPNNERGYIYFAHEIRGGDDIYKMVLGPRHSNEDNQTIYSSNHEQGIALGEVFSYEIDQQGARIDAIIRRGVLNGPIISHQYVDMLLTGSALMLSSSYKKAPAKWTGASLKIGLLGLLLKSTCT